MVEFEKHNISLNTYLSWLCLGLIHAKNRTKKSHASVLLLDLLEANFLVITVYSEWCVNNTHLNFLLLNLLTNFSKYIFVHCCWSNNFNYLIVDQNIDVLACSFSGKVKNQYEMCFLSLYRDHKLTGSSKPLVNVLKATLSPELHRPDAKTWLQITSHSFGYCI
jgi:hypothetical protein